MKLDINKYDALDEETIMGLFNVLDASNSVDEVLTLVNEIAKDKYDLGFEDGHDSGRMFGYDEGYDDGLEYGDYNR